MSLLKTFSPLLSFVRNGSHYRYTGMVRYPGGIYYYPRFPNQNDPEVTPSKLFRVERIRPLKGVPRVLRNIMTKIGLGESEVPCNRVVVLKNIPESNVKLWKVKHLIKVTPIVFPYGEPTANDIEHTLLKENGECIVTKELVYPVERVEARVAFNKSGERLSKESVERDSRLKWLNARHGGFE